MDPVSIGILAAQLIPTGVKLYQSHKQKKEAEEMAALAGDRPQYEIPSAVEEALNIAKSQASQTRLPGQDLIEQNIKGSTASTATRIKETAGSSAEALGALALTGSREQEQMQQLGIMGAQYQDRKLDELKRYLQNYSQYQDKQFEINKMQPYMAATAASSALTGASMQNMYSGVSDLSGVASNTLQTPGMFDGKTKIDNDVSMSLDNSGYELSGQSGEINPEIIGWLDAQSTLNSITG